MTYKDLLALKKIAVRKKQFILLFWIEKQIYKLNNLKEERNQ